MKLVFGILAYSAALLVGAAIGITLVGGFTESEVRVDGVVVTAANERAMVEKVNAPGSTAKIQQFTLIGWGDTVRYRVEGSWVLYVMLFAPTVLLLALVRILRRERPELRYRRSADFY